MRSDVNSGHRNIRTGNQTRQLQTGKAGDDAGAFDREDTAGMKWPLI